eukprot:807817-Pelagomonas_calceolata.AAC.1
MWKGKGYIAVPAYEGSSAQNVEARRERKKVVLLLGLLNCSNCTKNTHGIRNKTIDLISLLLQEMRKERKGKGYTAVPAYEGSLAEA